MNYLLIIAVTFAVIFIAIAYIYSVLMFMYKRQTHLLTVAFDIVNSSNDLVTQNIKLQEIVQEQFLEIENLKTLYDEDLPY